ncbi:rhodanese-related sulfurtransferase [Pullulanibacillus pueri]|uniref:Rhodanese-like domain-containing protein n=1 Tax=Pullulanibacillus pueri TaxID=1437324 RepID=A0A8J2ZZ24_9BACL|nr:rhodanese-like domain-containing protein [Pullulanibacillus pueri]MBM7683826.1 rhodanese-related sulfurtransferase [Pullulanibacillus pueri]GGH87760.1 rhodanese-like domain-containing protein [Pullulanibacillus pueri]
MADQIETIFPEEVEEKLTDSNANIVLVDVREDEEVATGKIAEALHIPLGQLPERFEELDKSKTVITVCRSGRRSEKAAEFLQEQGYKVINMTGGMMKWTGDIKA